MNIVLDFDSSTATAPAGFDIAIQNAATFLDSLLLDNITVTIDVGYGTYDGAEILSDDLSEGGASNGYALGYAELLTDLRNDPGATSPTTATFLADLPKTDPANGQSYFISDAQGKALGVQAPGGVTANSSEIDGYIGFSNAVTWAMSDTSGVAPNDYDLYGAALAELTHALGRLMPLNDTPTENDLMAYSAPGIVDTTNAGLRYLSLDGGQTNLAELDGSSDPADFADGLPDALDAHFNPGVAYPWSVLDTEIMGASGFNIGPLGVFDNTNQAAIQAVGTAYNGPVAGLQNEYVSITPDSLNITVTTPNWFIAAGNGIDYLKVTSGNNIIDGGASSDFMVGGTGNDTFYMDARTATAPIFSTIENFHPGDSATIWGVNATDFAMLLFDNQGAPGATGLDILFTAPGHVNTSFVLTGYSSADLQNGRLSYLFNTTPDLPGIPGSQYMTIHAN